MPDGQPAGGIETISITAANGAGSPGLGVGANSHETLRFDEQANRVKIAKLAARD